MLHQSVTYKLQKEIYLITFILKTEYKITLRYIFSLYFNQPFRFNTGKLNVVFYFRKQIFFERRKIYFVP